MGGQQTTRYPSLLTVKLQPCCKKTLAEIREKKELGRVLQRVLGASPLLLLTGATKLPDAAFTIVSTDWDLTARAMKSVPAIVRNRCQQLADFEILNHPGGELNRFWRAMHDSFR